MTTVLEVLSLLLSTVLPVDVFSRTAAEVVGLVFFRDNVSPSTLSTADFGGEPSKLCLDCDDILIREKRGQHVVRHVDRCAGIAHEAYVRQYAKDAICRGTLENGRQDVKPHPLIKYGIF
ncbi:hypothetical protein B0J14DRAFT_569620 [Halenospora varia]|nr:hypothetical protein B0J14DRAFT_569620 [Halenospora varia]